LSGKSIIKKLVHVVKYQLTVITRDVSIATLRSKLSKGVFWGGVVFGIVVFFPFGLIIRYVTPIVTIRFGYFSIHRIGHLAFDVDYYLASRQCEQQEGIKDALDVFFLVGEPCNTFLLQLIKRQLKTNSFARIPYYSQMLMPRSDSSRLLPSWKVNGSRDHKGYLAQTKPQLNLSNSEEHSGVDRLVQTGWKPGEPIVCLVVRDAAYLKTINSDKNWSYHSYRDTSISSYRATAIALAEKGYWVFRMGKVVEEEFEVNHPQVVDYATSTWKDDFLDVWLMSRCEFCISTSTGFDSLASIFRKPLALVNFMPLAEFQTWSSCVLAPSHLIWNKTGRRLTCREHLEHCYMRMEQYVDAGITVKELSESEVLGVVNELELRISRNWVESDNAEQCQRLFWEIYKNGGGWTPRDAFFHPDARFSSHFLDANPGFLN